jgi:hypothetical protein
MLGGRPYRSAAQQTTIAQSGYLMAVLYKHGLNPVIDRGGDLFGAILDAGCAAELVAALVTEDGKPWSRDDAIRNAALFNALPNDENSEFWTALSQLLTDFFPLGGSSSPASPTSSTRPPRQTAARGRKPRRPATTPENSTASGPTSPPTSPSAPAGA